MFIFKSNSSETSSGNNYEKPLFLSSNKISNLPEFSAGCFPRS